MAIPCQGFTFTWRGTAIGEVRSLEFSRNYQYDSATVYRDGSRGGWSVNGEVRFVSLAPSVLDQSQFGFYGTLSVAVPNTAGTTSIKLFDGPCVYTGQAASAAPNGAISFAHVFKVYGATKALSST